MHRTKLLAAVLLAAPLIASAQEETAASSPAPTATPTPAPVASSGMTTYARTKLGWRETGLVGPMFRWEAGAGGLAAVSDRYGSGKDPGWFLQLSPRLLLERPPARVSGWLSYEPALQSRAGLPPRAESPFDLEQRGRDGARPSTAETKVQHQGSAGVSVGDGVGARLAVEAKHRVTLDQLRTEQDGLVEHVESTGSGALEWIETDRWSAALKGSAARVRYPLDGIRVEDHDRTDASLETTVRFHLRMAGTLRLSAGDKRYLHAVESDGSKHSVQSYSALTHVEMQPMPSLSFRGSGGVAVRRDPDATVDTPIAAGLTADFRRRYRFSFDAGTALEDSLWRSNRHVRIYHGAARFTASIRRDWDAALTSGFSAAEYPERESKTGGAPDVYRNDLTWGAGAELSTRPGGRFRTTLAVSHSERRSTFPGYGWEENRCVLSAYIDW